MTGTRTAVVLSLLAAMLAGACGAREDGAAPSGARRDLLIVLDGLRPDYVTSDLMPALVALGRRGVVMRSHHAVYPTVTRVNAASISTGAYPETHGLLGNGVYMPEVDPAQFLDTSDRANLLRIEASGAPLLTATTLGEALAAAGERLLVVSAGSAGSAYLLNHTAAGGGILHYDFSVPSRLHARAVAVLGPVPEAAAPNWQRNRWAVDALLQVGLPEVDPAVAVLWLSDPDTTAHRHGIGHPLTNEALFYLDAEIARIQTALGDAGLLETTNIWVTSDHGFSEHTGAVDVSALLAPFDGRLDDGTPRVVAGGGAIYVRDGDETAVGGIVAALRAAPEVGAVFTRGPAPGATAGRVDGTLSFGVARWDHARAGAVLFSPNWTDAAGANGYPGTSAQPGVAGHGSASPFDIHNTLIAAGPDLKRGVTLDAPSGNVDFAPTFLYLRGLEPPASMQGRVLRDALRDEPPIDGTDIEVADIRATAADGRYVVTAATSAVDGRTYLDYTTAERP